MQDEVDDPADFLGVLLIHKQFVEGNIAKFKENERVLSKYLWLKKYHNAVAQARLTRDLYKDHLVNGPENKIDVPLLSPILRPDDNKCSDDQS